MGCKHSTNKGADAVDEPKSTSPTKPAETAKNVQNDVSKNVKNLPTFHISQGDFVKSKTTKFRDEYVVKDQLGQGIP